MAAMSISQRMSGGAPMGAGKMAKGASQPGGDGGHYELHPHEDGSAHSVTPDGQEMQHPSMHHAMMHVAGHHDGEGAHSIVKHHAEGGHTSHHHKEGETSGPHEHEDMESVKQHMQGVAGEDGGGEGGKDQYDGESEGSGGLF